MPSAKLMLTAAVIALLSAAGSATAQTAPPSSTTSLLQRDFQGFMRPQVIRALYHEDMALLKRVKTATFQYLLQIIEAFDAPDAWYRVGQEMEARLDPSLGPTARALAITNRDLLQAMSKTGLGALSGMFGEWLPERQDQMATGRLDPNGEAAALSTGLLRGIAPLAKLKIDAGHDAKLLMLAARENPEEFLRIYNGIRAFIHSY